MTDTADTLFGVREITVDAKYGFCLNGRSLKLKGGCIHSDNGILGAASYYDSEYRKVKLHKDNGFNALRFAHNPVPYAEPIATAKAEGPAALTVSTNSLTQATLELTVE